MRKIFRKAISLLCVLTMLLTLFVPAIPAYALENAGTGQEIQGIDDPLNDFSKIFEHSNVKFQTDVPASFMNDASRLRRTAAEGGFIYKTDYDIQSFRMDVFFGESALAAAKDPEVCASGDGVNYTPLELRSETFANPSFPLTRYEAYAIEPGIRYLKITLSDKLRDGKNLWSPQVSRVLINLATAPVEASPSPAEVTTPAVITLSTVTEDAEIYYHTDKDPTDKLYTGPIQISESMAITAYAGKEGMADSSVRTFAYTINAGEPGSGQEIRTVDDPLDDFSKIVEHSNVRFQTDVPEKFMNDASRLRRTALDGYFIYKIDEDIKSFQMDVFYGGDAAVMAAAKDPEVYASGDGVNYTPLELRSETLANPSFPLIRYGAYAIEPGIRYLKITLSDKLRDGKNLWSPQVSRVLINLATAPVEASPAPFKITSPTAITLSTETEDAEIYYHTDKDTVDKLYTGPIQISESTSTQITAYAKKEGMVDSYARTFIYTSAADEIVDRYGQMKNVDFPTKVTSDDRLKADVAADEAYYGSLTPPERDAYGGLPESKESLGLNATGYFHIEKLSNGRSVMVDPLGNAFFSLGVDGVGKTNNTYTVTSGREQLYEWLPSIDDQQYRDAFRLGAKDIFSFYVANKIKKTGHAFGNDTGNNNPWFYEEGMNRLIKWGFNSEGGFASPTIAQSLGFPNVPFLSLPDDASDPGISYFDIFSPGIADKIDASLAVQLPQSKDDPTIIGYFIGNEYAYHQIKNNIPKAKASKVPSKGRLVELLKEKYNNDITAFNTAWGTSIESFDAMDEAELSVTTEAASADMDGFIKLYLDTFYSVISTSFRKYDPNHMLMGDRWFVTPMNDSKLRQYLCEAGGKYLDVLSYNYYTYDLDLKRIESMYEMSGGKPILFSEFQYGEPTQGLTRAMRMADNEDEKGKMYRNYVEKAAASGYVVGTHWYEYLDQAATGRHFQGYEGENFAIGLLNVADRPYKTMLSSVMETNYNIYDIVLGNKEPYSFDFGNRGDRQSDKTMNISKTASPITIDGVLDSEWEGSEPVILDDKDRILGSMKYGVSAEMRLAWDQDNLYLIAHILDGTPMMNDKTGRSVWNGDAIEVFVGPENVEQGGAIQVKDSQVILSGGVINGDFQYCWANNAPQSPIGMAVMLDGDGKGYTIESAIPMSGLNITDPQAGRKIRFDIGFDDGAGSGRERQFLWNGMDGNSASREKWGKAILYTPDAIPPAKPEPDRETDTGTTPAPAVTYDGDTSTVSIEVKPATNRTTGAASAWLNTAALTALLEKAKREKTGVIAINSKISADTGAIEIGLQRDAFKQLADDTEASVRIDAGIATIAFDAKAVDSISSSAAAGNIRVGIKSVDKSLLTQETQDKVGDRPVYEFTVKAGNTEFSKFGGGKAEISIPYTLKPGEKKNSVVVYYIDDSGKLKTVKGRYDEDTGTVKFATNHFSTYAVGYNEVNFNDVASGSWYDEAVGFMAARDIINGVGGGKFAPSGNVTRGDFLIMAMNSYGIAPDSEITDNFLDTGDRYYTPYLAAAKRLGLVTGIGDNRFAPEAAISRQDMLVILYRVLESTGELPEAISSGNSPENAGRTLDSFSDAKEISKYALDAMNLFAEAGIVSGDGENLAPKAPASRSQAAIVLYNLLIGQ